MDYDSYFFNTLLHYFYVYRVIIHNPKSILEIGCGTATHSVAIKKLLRGVELSLLDTDSILLKKNKEEYGDLIKNTFNYSILDGELIRSLPKFDVVISQGLMEHFPDKDFLLIIDNFSKVTNRIIFSIPSDVYCFKDFGNEILRSKKELSILLDKSHFNYRVDDYFIDIGIRTKMKLVKENKLGFFSALRLLFFKSCHLLVEVNYNKINNE